MISKFILILCLIINTNNCIAQNNNIKERTLSESQYEIINDLFGPDNSNRTLYYKTDLSKTWSLLITPDRLNMLLGPPCNDGSKILKWNDIFDTNDFKKLKNEIIHLKSYDLDKTKLNKSIEISKSYEKSVNNKEVTIISAPIILGNYALIKQSSFYGESILVASKTNDKWSVICRKSVFQILE